MSKIRKILENSMIYFLRSDVKVRLGNLAKGVNIDEAVTVEQLNEVKKQTVGLSDAKDSVRVITTQNVVLSGVQTIDGVLLSDGDRIGVISNTNAAENGIWIVRSGAWQRAEDADTSEEITTFMYFGVEEGTTGEGKIFYLSTTGTITLNNTDLTFKEYSSATTINTNRVITRDFTTLKGITIQSDNLVDFVEKVFYPAESPSITTSISGGTQRELGANPGVTIAWTVTKKTYGINSINIAGTGIAPSVDVDEDSDINGNTQSGNVSTSSTANTNTTFNSSVQAQNGNQVVNSSNTLTWLPARYWGRIGVDGLGNVTSDINDIIANPTTDSQVLSLQGAGVGTGKFLANNLAGTYNGIDGQSQFLIFACIAGTSPVFKVNGLLNTAWTKVRSNTAFTNGNGYIFNIDVWVSNTTQNSPIDEFVIE